MSRTKKSRKPGLGSNGALKESVKKDLVAPPKRAKKSHGKAAGNRQNEATDSKTTQQSGKKDPRLGNKTPIFLGKPLIKQPFSSNKKPKEASVTAIRTAAPTEDNGLMAELEAIEQNERLQFILEKQDDDIELTESEVDFFNEKMERHQVLRELLGLDEEDEDEDENDYMNKNKSSSEDDLWDKFDNSDLSKFE